MFDALKSTLRGPLLLLGDPGYDDSRSVWNAMIDRRPAAIARCLGVADVVACVRFAREQGLLLSVKAGGHNISGLAVHDGGLMLDFSLMRGVFVDPAARIAHAQGGCLLGDIDRETQVHGLAAVMGFVSTTGAAGVTLGGGFGYISRRFGWTSDNVLSMQVVTADGRVVRASEKENPDLFWGLRGGGSNFGIVTDFEHRLHPVGPEIVGGAVAWRVEDAPQVLELYLDLMKNAPLELAVVWGLRDAPPAPWLPKEMHGKPIVALFVCHTGPVEEAEKSVRAIKSFGNPVADIVQRRPYAGQQSLLDTANPKGRRYYWKSEFVPAVTTDLLQASLLHAQKVPSPHSALLVFPLGGVAHELPEDHSAAGNRNAAALFNIASSWEKAADDQVNIEWTRAAWRDMRRFSTGGTYVNFLTEEEGDARIHDAYGKNFDRLVDVKTKWDPENLFRTNKNILPRGS
jgi:FAD/FMN-containing dehydrogenase